MNGVVKYAETEKAVKTAVKMAVEIKRRFNEDGIFDYELNKEFTEFVYENAIFVSFDADDIPEMVEDETI